METPQIPTGPGYETVVYIIHYIMIDIIPKCFIII